MDNISENRNYCCVWQIWSLFFLLIQCNVNRGFVMTMYVICTYLIRQINVFYELFIYGLYSYIGHIMWNSYWLAVFGNFSTVNEAFCNYSKMQYTMLPLWWWMFFHFSFFMTLINNTLTTAKCLLTYSQLL